jgi:hypothetical protein
VGRRHQRQLDLHLDGRPVHAAGGVVTVGGHVRAGRGSCPEPARRG